MQRSATKVTKLVSIVEDAFINNAMYSGVLCSMGNNGKADASTRIDLEKLTEGVLNAITLLECNNMSCFLLQATAANEPNLLKGVLDFVLDAINPHLAELGVPSALLRWWYFAAGLRLFAHR